MYSYDTITGEVSQQEVTATFVLESDHINYLTFIDEDGDEQIIEVTDSHPFWVVSDDPDFDRGARDYVEENGVLLYHEDIECTEYGYWVEAKDLQEGDVFIGANGELSTLIATERVEFPDGVKVYNFTVEENHNYFVIAEVGDYGQTSILVHNGSCSYETGLQGEKNAGIVKNTNRIEINNRIRIPDEVTSTMITEVKNVKKQHLSTQIKDYMDIAKRDQKLFRLIVRHDTVLTKPLQDLVNRGKIILERMNLNQ